MKKLAWTIMVLVCFSEWRILMAQSNAPKLRAELPGASLKWIHAAEPEFQRRNLDVDNYVVAVSEQNDSVMVTLRSTDTIESSRGSTGKHPGYEVEISKRDLKVLRSNFVR